MLSQLFTVLFGTESNRPPREHYQYNVLLAITLIFIVSLVTLIVQLLTSYVHSTSHLYMGMLLGMLSIQVINLYLIRRDRFKTASWILLLTTGLTLGYGIYYSNGLYSSGTMFINVTLILAVLLLGWVQATFITIATLIFIGFLYFVEVAGFLPEAPFKDLPFRFIMLTITFVAIVLLVSYHVYMLEITQHRNIELRLQQERQLIYRQLTQDVSHDLRTPLSVLKANSYLIRQRYKRDMPIEEQLCMIDLQVERLQHIIEDFDELIELEKQATSNIIPFAPVDLQQLLQIVVNNEQGFAEARQIHLSYDVPPNSTLMTYGNGIQLSRLFSNLVQNAINYGKKEGYVKVSIRQKADSISISVEDNGLGIAPEDKEKIFNRFYRTDEARTATDKSGSGIGLSIVKTILDLHHGYIQVDSTPGEGTTMTVKLTAYQPAPSTMSIASAPNHVPS